MSLQNNTKKECLVLHCFQHHWQGCALEALGCHRRPTFAFGQLEKLSFFIIYMLKSWAPKILWLGTFEHLAIFRTQPWLKFFFLQLTSILWNNILTTTFTSFMLPDYHRLELLICNQLIIKFLALCIQYLASNTFRGPGPSQAAA